MTEAGGTLTIGATAGQNAVFSNTGNQGPHLTTGAPGHPYMVSAKINSWLGNDDSNVGLLVAIRDMPSATLYMILYGPDRDDGGPRAGLTVYRNNAADPGVVLNTMAWATWPVWIRIRSRENWYNAYGLYFDYSTDGITWTNQYTWNGAWNHSYPESCGMFARNWAAFNAVWVEFDEFKMTRCLGPR